MERRRRRRRIRRTEARARRCYPKPVISALVLGWAACLNSLAWAQTNGSTCSTAPITTPIRVDDAAGVATLRSEASCINRGSLQAEWVGAAVPIDSPIAIASGTSLTVTGDDALAEAQGGSSQTRLFEVSPGGSLTLTQLKLSGGAAGNGGAIHSDSGSLMLNNCTFEGNTATEGDGGAVWADGGSVTIVGGKFLSNNATLNGGAVHATDANLVVREGTRFESNKAAEGGALYCGAAGLGAATGSGPSCSITNAEFVSNNASLETFLDLTIVGPWEDLNGGGAAAFWFTEADITDSVFTSNYAQFTGGAVFGGNDTDIKVQGCSFALNTAKGYGGAVGASSMMLGGDTQLVDNKAIIYHGGAVFGWNATGAIQFNDVLCRNNTAPENGGCFYGAGESLINDGTVMLDNVGHLGGCIYASSTCDMEVAGGTFTCQCSQNGAFMFATDGARVNITGGLIENNVATRRAGAVYCSGETFDLGGSKVTIEGGVFRNNRALELGGAIVAWGTIEGLNPTVVTITGGEFVNNTAKFYGGFIFLEQKASLNCKGANVSGNYAGDQGGGIYGREAKWVNSSCDLIGNTSPNGAAIYLTNVKSATFENHEIAANLASGGSVVYVAASSVVAKEVMFKSGVALQEDSSNRAIQLDGDSTLNAEECVFDGWRGDTVVYHRNSASGSLVLDSCDFSRSSATMAVISPHSDAEIRNAVVSSVTFENAAGTLNNSLTLVDRALDCSDSNACGSGKCGNSTLGVLCECLEGSECLDGGGELSLRLESSPGAMTFDPDPVSYKLLVASAATGTTNAIWVLHFDSVDLTLDVVPSSGVLIPGSSVTVTVSGTPSSRDVGGNLISTFHVTSVASASSDATGDAHLNVESTFYLCPAYQYANPVVGDDDMGFSCEPCASIGETDGVNCENAGATLASLPIREGFWRPSPESLNVHACLHEEACVGATAVSSSDDYCEDGYRGPYCAVCAEGYGKSLSNTCYSCHGIRARLLIITCTVFSFVGVVMLVLAVVFLIGGLDALYIVRQSTIHRLSSVKLRSGGGPTEVGGSVTTQPCQRAPTEMASIRPLGAVNRPGNGTKQSCATGRHPPDYEATLTTRDTRRRSFAAGTHVSTTPVVDRRLDDGGGGCVTSTCCLFGKKINKRAQQLPLNKLKILVGVWQILAVFSTITGAEFPASYALFLSWINVLNFDLGYIFKASCILPSLNFYQQLLATTLSPLVVSAGLMLTYRIANGRAGIGSAGVTAKWAAWSRHLSAGFILTFLVFTSTSSSVVNTFPCDENVVDGESYLIADYSISCDTTLHAFFQAYAAVMVLVYPIGIPALYFVVLWKHRELLNPQIHAGGKSEASNAAERATRTSHGTRGDSAPAQTHVNAPKSQSNNESPPLTLKELEERVKARAEHPELAPIMFLWRDFDPNMYYYEVIECGRRIFLTDVLILIQPHTVTQAATGCIFAFLNLLAFELLRPHLDPADTLLYRLGCVLIFLSMFLAMLTKMDVMGEANQSALGIYMVVLNVVMILAAAWTILRHAGDSSGEEAKSTA